MKLIKHEFVLKDDLPRWALYRRRPGALALEFDDFPCRILGIIRWNGEAAELVANYLRGPGFEKVPLYYLSFVSERLLTNNEVDFQGQEEYDFMVRFDRMSFTKQGLQTQMSPYWQAFTKRYHHDHTYVVFPPSQNGQNLTPRMIDLGDRMIECIKLAEGLLVDPNLAWQFDWAKEHESIRKANVRIAKAQNKQKDIEDSLKTHGGVIPS